MRADVKNSMPFPESLLKSIVKVGCYDQLLFLPFKSQIMDFEKKKIFNDILILVSYFHFMITLVLLCHI